MADRAYTPGIYRKIGGDQLVVASGASILMETGGKILPNSGTQAATIAALSSASGTFIPAERAKFNLVLTALKNVGILATS